MTCQNMGNMSLKEVMYRGLIYCDMSEYGQYVSQGGDV